MGLSAGRVVPHLSRLPQVVAFPGPSERVVGSSSGALGVGQGWKVAPDGAPDGRGAHGHCSDSLRDTALGPVLPFKLPAPMFLEVGLLR